MAVLSIDDTVLLTYDTGAPDGFNLFTTTELQGTPDAYNQSAYYDDITLSLITGPKITKTSIDNGTNLVAVRVCERLKRGTARAQARPPRHIPQ